MRLNFFCILCLFFLVPSISTAQQFSFGPVNGINLSNIRGDLKYDQWKARPGPVNGLFLKTPLLGNWLSVRTGAEYISFYYKRQQTPTYYPNEFWRMNGLPGPGSSVVPENSIIMPPYYTTNTIDWHFLRIPLMLEWKTPGRISFGFGAGAHYSFLMNDEFTGKDKELKSDEYREENFPQSTDWGWILSSSLSYQVNNQWNLFLEGRTTWGKEVYMENPERKNGASELLFGVGYSPFTRQKTSRFGTFTGERIELLPHAGISFSNSTHEDEKKHYATLPGFNTGISVKYKTDSVFSFISGAWYERKGYRITKPSQSRIAYLPHVQAETPPDLYSDIMLDYLTIPLIAELSIESRFTLNLQAGIYYSFLQDAVATGTETQTTGHQSGYQTERNYFRQNIEGWFKNSDWGGLTGARLEYRLSPKIEIFTTLNRSWGFTRLGKKIEEEEQNAAFNKLKYFKNRSWTAVCGLAISIAQNKEDETSTTIHTTNKHD